MAKYYYSYAAGSGLLLGRGEMDKSPLEEDVYLLPALATTTKPPDFDPDKFAAVWSGSEWVLKPRESK